MGTTRRFALLLLCALAGPAAADGLDGERFVPAVGVVGGFQTEHPAVPFHLGWGLGVFLNLADDQVVTRDNATGDVVTRPVDTGFTTDLVGSLGLWGRAEFGIHLPLHLIYEGDMFGGFAADNGVGDLRFVPKVALIRTGSLDNHVLLSFALPISFPTGSDENLRGAGGFSIEPELLFALHTGPLGIGVGAGYIWRSEEQMGLPWGNEVAIDPWLAFRIGDALTIRGEVYMHKIVDADVDNATFPVDVLGGLDYQITPHWDFYAGAQLGVTDGVGDPDIRGIAGIRYRAGAPEREGFRDDDGDGVMDKDDDCATAKEDEDGFQDDDGCPEDDNDRDGIPDDEDECPELDGDRAHQGCPARTFVKIEDGKVYIFGKVQFRTGSDEIQPQSEPLLDQIAEALNANPQVKRVRVEGHTDNVGGPGINQRLSDERAASVKKALEKRGVDGDRLETRGYGENRPIAPNKTAAGKAKNRRVEFIIVR
jgi:OmpA-OmpF porin, OOP family